MTFLGDRSVDTQPDAPPPASQEDFRSDRDPILLARENPSRLAPPIGGLWTW